MLTGGIAMYAVIAILMIILIAGVSQLYLDNRDAFRRSPKVNLTGDKFHDESNRRLS